VLVNDDNGSENDAWTFNSDTKVDSDYITALISIQGDASCDVAVP